MDCESDKFNCRKCRQLLFEWKDLSKEHPVSMKCSLWYLRDDNILPWVLHLINEGGWTKGKLVCPKCAARVGAFDFLHLISCECGEKTIPAIYCVKSKLDHSKKALRLNSIKVTDNNGELSPTNKDRERKDMSGLSGFNDLLFDSADQEHFSSSFNYGLDERQIPDVTMTTEIPQGETIELQTIRGEQRCLPKVLACSACRTSYEQLVKESQEKHARMMDVQLEDFVNISYNSSQPSEDERSFIQRNMEQVQTELDNLQGLIQNEKRYSQISEKKKPSFSRNVEANSDELFEVPLNHQCAVCLELYFDPHKTPCGHVFCGPCLRHMKTSQRKPHCPMCRHRVQSVTHCQELENNLKSLYTEQYRQRSELEGVRSINKYPLPSPHTVKFDETPREAVHINKFVLVLRTCLIILYLLVTFLLNASHMQRRTRYFKAALYILMGLGATASICALYVFFTLLPYDLFKFLIGFVLFYLVVTKFLLRHLV